MPWQLLADLILLLHLGFILFVVLGAMAVWRWPRLAWGHVPAALWGALVEFTGWVCPLTPLENALRARAGESGYPGGFIAHYLEPVIYPAGLTREIGLLLGLGVVLINVVLYGLIWRRHRRHMRRTPHGARRP